jgi:hypothetical protein
MILIYERMKNLLPSLNRRRITWRMIVRAVNKLGAKLFCLPLRLDGYFVPSSISESGKPEIYINSRLSDDLQIATAVHEIKHGAFDFDLGVVLFSYRREWTAAARRGWDQYHKFEFEACAMGAMALLPETKLKHASRGLFDETDEFLEDLWKIRLYTRENYRI